MLVEQRVARLDKEIDTVVADIKAEKGKLEGLRAERRQASPEDRPDYDEEIQDLKQSIADLKARLQSKEQERRELTQSLLGR